MTKKIASTSQSQIRVVRDLKAVLDQVVIAAPAKALDLILLGWRIRWVQKG